MRPIVGGDANPPREKVLFGEGVILGNVYFRLPAVDILNLIRQQRCGLWLPISWPLVRACPWHQRLDIKSDGG